MPYVLSDELERLVRQTVLQVTSSHQPRPQRGRRPRRAKGGGGSTSNLTSFAVVTEEAGPSTYSSDGIAGGAVGKAVLLDEDMQKSSTNPDDQIEFKSLHFVRVPADSIISLHSAEVIEPGSQFASKKVWGQFVSAPYELYQLSGAAEKKILWLPTGATSPEDMEWAGAQC